MKRIILLILTAFILMNCSKTPTIDSDQTIYFNGEIITMEGEKASTVEAVVTIEKTIVFTGKLDEAEKQYPNALKQNLRGNTMMPGFIEQHLHPFLAGLTLVMNIIAPEPWKLPHKTWKGVITHKDYIETLTSIEKEMENPDEILMSWGYHNNFHGELNRKILDDISDTRPILVWHRSCHEMYLNTVLMQKLNLDNKWFNKFNKNVKAQMDMKNGHFYEAGLIIALLPKIFPIIGSNKLMERGLKQMVEMLHKNGVTAYNEPGAFVFPSHLALYHKVLGDSLTPMYSFFTPGTKRVFAQSKEPDTVVQGIEKITQLFPETGKIRFFKKQVKILFDGAIVSQLMMMKDGYLDGHQGEWIQDPQEISKIFDIFWKLDYQILVHVNGDKGLEELLNIIERKVKEYPRKDHRTTIIHFATSTEEQVKKIAALGCIVSANPYYVTAFTDKYAEVGLGSERANAMVRLASVFLFHYILICQLHLQTHYI